MVTDNQGIQQDLTTRERVFQTLAIVIGCFALIGFFIAFGAFAIGEPDFSISRAVKSDKLGDLGSFLGGTAGAIWSLVGVIFFYIALMLQTRELRLQREAHNAILEDSEVKNILDLYQAFTTPEFRVKKQKAWNVLKLCIANKDYSHFVIGHFFPVSISPNGSRVLSHSLAHLYKNHAQERFPELGLNTYKDIAVAENDARHALDDCLSFFNLLTLRQAKVRKEIFLACEFYYSHWRPLLWFVCYERERCCSANPEISKYSRHVNMKAMLQTLDNLYGYNKIDTEAELLVYIKGHPIIAEFKVDPNHDFVK